MDTISIAAIPARSNCPTCSGHQAQPYRRIIDGEIMEGCIDAFHSDAMLHMDAGSAEWHWRPDAIEFRATIAAAGCPKRGL